MSTSPNTKPRLVILDSHGILFRAFFALGQAEKPLMTSKGELTFATYGYAESLLRVVEELRPTHICAAWDAPGKTFRHEASEAYKATRRETPSDLIPQMERVREMLDAFRIPVYEMPGYEADDVAGTIAARAAEQGIETYIVTLDTDLVQLLGPNVKLFMFRPFQRDTVVYDEARAAERWGFSPAQMVDFKALKGDASDNIPGVRGIGDKTATALIRQFGSAEAIFDHLDEIQPSIRKKLEGARDQVIASKELVRIHTDLPIDFDLDACRVHDYDHDRVVELFHELEFRRLLERLPDVFGAAPPVAPAAVTGPLTTEVVATPAALERLAAALREAETVGVVGISSAGDTFHPLLLGLAFAAAPGKAWYVPVGHAPRLDGNGACAPMDAVRSTLGPLLADPAVTKAAYDGKRLMHLLDRQGMALEGLFYDASIMAFLLGETSSALENLIGERLGMELRPYSALTGTGRNAVPLSKVDIEAVAELACQHADALLRVLPGMEHQLRDQGQWPLYDEMELPLMPVLFRMERVGVAVDISVLSELSQAMIGDIQRVEQEIYRLVGHEFNIGSPQQLSDVLFGEIGLPKTRKMKQGYSTDQRALEGLREAHPIIDKIFEYRQLTKLKSTYLDALPGAVAEDGRIHTEFQQTVAATGRLSSTNPNLQNIPVRTDMGRDIRRAFIAAGFDDPLFVSADYSQIELRILAHVTGDPGLIEAFLAGEDIHRSTAARVYGVSLEEVTRQMRDTAKMVNFGIAYGMGEFGLASRTGMSREEAAAFIETYYAKYPGIKAWQEQTLAATREKGYAETIFGRRRYLPAIRSQNFQVRSAAEREAINMPIQGTAADIIKLAMIRVDTETRERKLQSRMILQVHDELIFEGPAAEADTVAEMLARIMPGELQMKVPLKVEVKRGRNWSELK
ncbi:MAG: DNA polymerase I [Dehalococcoidia bacterium]